MVNITEFKEENAAAASELIHSVLEKNNKDDMPDFALKQLFEVYKPEGLKQLAKSRKRKLYVAHKDENIVGTVGIEENNITTLFVNPQFQMKGIGTQLLKFAEDKIRRTNYSHLMVNSSLSAIPFFQKFGFKKSSDFILEGEVVSQLMKKPFNSIY